MKPKTTAIPNKNNRTPETVKGLSIGTFVPKPWCIVNKLWRGQEHFRYTLRLLLTLQDLASNQTYSYRNRTSTMKVSSLRSQAIAIWCSRYSLILTILSWFSAPRNKHVPCESQYGSYKSQEPSLLEWIRINLFYNFRVNFEVHSSEPAQNTDWLSAVVGA